MTDLAIIIITINTVILTNILTFIAIREAMK